MKNQKGAKLQCITSYQMQLQKLPNVCLKDFFVNPVTFDIDSRLRCPARQWNRLSMVRF